MWLALWWTEKQGVARKFSHTGLICGLHVRSRQFVISFFFLVYFHCLTHLIIVRLRFGSIWPSSIYRLHVFFLFKSAFCCWYLIVFLCFVLNWTAYHILGCILQLRSNRCAFIVSMVGCVSGLLACCGFWSGGRLILVDCRCEKSSVVFVCVCVGHLYLF